LNFEQAILSSLVHNPEYVRKVLPFLKNEYFHEVAEAAVFEIIRGYVTKYNSPPSKETILIEINDVKDADASSYRQMQDVVSNIATDSNHKLEWLVAKTEEFCKDRAIHNALIESVAIYEDKNGKKPRGLIPKLLSDAMAVSFDNSIGHDYFEQSDERFAAYHETAQKIPFDLDIFNRITKGGVSKKSLTCLLAATHVGKSLFMCHFAAANIAAGNNVLYITLEMGEIGDPSIAERIDANLLNISINDLLILPKDAFDKKLARITSKTHGRLIIKEYPTATASVSNFRALLDDLKLKKNFVPDIVYIDYLNICCSSRLKMGAGVNSYTYIKAIAEEIRGLAQEYNIPIITATQTNRQGFNNSDLEMTETSESIGLPQTVDFLVALMQVDEMKDLKQVLVKQLKNRFGDMGYFSKFFVGIDKPKMKLYDIDQDDQEKEDDDTPVMNNTEFGFQDENRNKPKGKFDGFK